MSKRDPSDDGVHAGFRGARGPGLGAWWGRGSRRSGGRIFVQGKTIKAICRELNVSRKVVRKVLRSEATEF